MCKKLLVKLTDKNGNKLFNAFDKQVIKKAKALGFDLDELTIDGEIFDQDNKIGEDNSIYVLYGENLTIMMCKWKRNTPKKPEFFLEEIDEIVS